MRMYCYSCSHNLDDHLVAHREGKLSVLCSDCGKKDSCHNKKYDDIVPLSTLMKSLGFTVYVPLEVQQD